MSDESHRCDCRASFPTEEALKLHIDDYKLQIDFHSGRLTECALHSKATDSDGTDSDDVNDCDDLDKSIKHCPHESCSPSRTFRKGQGLRRHFATHVECCEVCVFCHKSYKIASEFLRHVKYYHQDENGTKTIYMQQTSREINAEVIRQLRRAKQVYVKKRRLDGTDASAETQQARRPRLDETAPTTHGNEYAIQGALVPAVSAAATPAIGFEDIVAMQLRDGNTSSKAIDASGSASVNAHDITREFYPYAQIEPTQAGRYDPDIARITNWPVNWDQALNQVLGISIASCEEL